MKITVPGFVTEENAREALRRMKASGKPMDMAALAAIATTLGMLEQFGGEAGIAAGRPDMDAGEINPSAPLNQEQLKFIETEAASRGADASEFKKFAPNMMKLMSQLSAFTAVHPKKEITLPDSAV
jgi:hypothetical protein